MPLFVVDIGLPDLAFTADPYLEVCKVLHQVADGCTSYGVSASLGEHVKRGMVAPSRSTFHLEIDLELLSGQISEVVAQLVREVAHKVEMGRESGLIKLQLTVKVGSFTFTEPATQ